jgi:hypothetical protein
LDREFQVGVAWRFTHRFISIRAADGSAKHDPYFVLLLGMIGKGKRRYGVSSLIEMIEGIGKPNQRKIER